MSSRQRSCRSGTERKAPPKHWEEAKPRSKVVLCAPVRTAIGTYGGTLKGLPAPELGVAAIRAAIDRAGLSATDMDTGQVVQAGAEMNPARQAMMAAEIAVNVPALTVNRVCGSGAPAIASAAQEVMLGHVSCAVAEGIALAFEGA